MAETIYWQDGSMSVLCAPEGGTLLDAFLNELREREPDAVRFFEEYHADADMALDGVRADAAEKELSADGLYRMCHDTLEDLEEIKQRLHALSHPTKEIKDIAARVTESYNYLYSNL